MLFRFAGAARIRHLGRIHPRAVVFRLGLAIGEGHYRRMIGVDNQETSPLRLWAERVLLASGAIVTLVMAALRVAGDFTPAYPYSLVWLGAAGLMGAGFALIYARLAPRAAPLKD